MVYNMTQFPLSSTGLDSISYLIAKILAHADRGKLDELDRLIIANSVTDDAFFYYHSEWMI